jgi:hypothetical protein
MYLLCMRLLRLRLLRLRPSASRTPQQEALASFRSGKMRMGAVPYFLSSAPPDDYAAVLLLNPAYAALLPSADDAQVLAALDSIDPAHIAWLTMVALLPVLKRLARANPSAPTIRELLAAACTVPRRIDLIGEGIAMLKVQPSPFLSHPTQNPA